MREFKGKLYFWAEDAQHGRELWVFDGTTVSMVMDICPGTCSSFLSACHPDRVPSWGGSCMFGLTDHDPYMTPFKDKLYFVAQEPTHGRELWVYDGTTAPSMVADLYPGSNGISLRTADAAATGVEVCHTEVCVTDAVNWGNPVRAQLSALCTCARQCVGRCARAWSLLVHRTVPRSAQPHAAYVRFAGLYDCLQR